MLGGAAVVAPRESLLDKSQEVRVLLTFAGHHLQEYAVQSVADVFFRLGERAHLGRALVLLANQRAGERGQVFSGRRLGR